MRMRMMHTSDWSRVTRTTAGMICLSVAMVLALPAHTDENRYVDQTVFPVVAETFGSDSYQNATWGVPLIHACGWDVMGMSKVQWQLIEPNAPQGGVHTYVWNTLDTYVQMVADGGKLLEIWISPNSSWASECYPGEQYPEKESPVLPQYLDDYQAFIQALVERYDGDGIDDLPGLDYEMIFQVKIGDEIELSGHWVSQCGTPQKYLDLLEHAYIGAKTASPNVLVCRASMSIGDICNDHPDTATLESRIPSVYMDYIDACVNNQTYYDVWDIHPSGKYTGGLAIVEYLRDYRGVNKIFCVDDTNTSPRNGHSDWSYTPWRYTDSNANNIEDIIDDLELNDPGNPTYENAKLVYYPDHAGMLIKRFVFQLMSGYQYSFAQPIMDGLNWGPSHVFRHAGLLDTVLYNETSDPYQTRKQAYWTFKWLYGKLLGVKAGTILKEDETPDKFFPLTSVYELTQANGDPLWVMWHDYTIDGNYPEHQQSYYYDLSTTATQVRVHYTIEDWDQEEPNYQDFDVVGGQVTLELTDLPIIVVPIVGTPPAAPTDLQAISAGQTAIDLSWTDNSDNETGFRIERSPNGTSGWVERDTVGANVTTYQDTGLNCNTTYYYRVCAYNGAGDSDYSNVANATTDDCPQNDPPVANDQSDSTDEDTPLNMTLSYTDGDGPGPYTFSTVTGPSHGTLDDPSSSPNWTYTPDENYNGSDFFTWKVNDGVDDSNTATFSITVDAVNDAPQFTQDPMSRSDACVDSAYSNTIGGSATDVENDPLIYSKVSGPTWLNVASDGALSGTPGAGDEGANSWTVKVEDGNGGEDTATLNIDVTSPPAKATNPNPANQATGVGVNADLSWTAGARATSHDVYFGTSSPPSFIQNQGGTTYDPGTMSGNTGYYWRIDEVNTCGTTTGDEWSFQTQKSGCGSAPMYREGTTYPSPLGSFGVALLPLLYAMAALVMYRVHMYRVHRKREEIDGL